MKIKPFYFIAIAAAAICLSGCGGSGPKTVAVNMREFSFSPEGITVPAGAEVTINLKNLGALVHNFHIMDAGHEITDEWADADEAFALLTAGNLEGGASTTLSFTAPATPGDYQFLCSVPAHFGLGMHGIMTVVAP